MPTMKCKLKSGTELLQPIKCYTYLHSFCFSLKKCTVTCYLLCFTLFDDAGGGVKKPLTGQGKCVMTQ